MTDPDTLAAARADAIDAIGGEATDLQAARAAVADAIVGELYAQLDDLSDNTEALIIDLGDDTLRPWAEEYRLTMHATITQRHLDYLADNL